MIYVTGDIHGNQFKWLEQIDPVLKEGDIMIVCGDFGIGFFQQKYSSEESFYDFISVQPYTVLFVDGNHENFELLDDYPVSRWHGGKVHFIKESVIHLMRGQIYTIDGKTFFTFGGGYSCDIETRVEHRSWWQQELPTTQEWNEALNNLLQYNFHVDYIITHDCPFHIKELLHTRTIPCNLNDYTLPHLRNIDEVMDDIEQQVTYKLWFSGHLHIDQTIYKHVILFNTIYCLER